MAINVYMNFQGNTKEVLRYYKTVFNSPDPEIMYFKDMPPSDDFTVPPEMADKVMHASLKINDDMLMFSDVLPGMPPDLKPGNNVQIIMSLPDAGRLKTYFDTLAKEGQVVMPFEATFWSKGYGAVTDKFGVEWQFNCDSE